MRTFSMDLFVAALEQHGWSVVRRDARHLLVGDFCELRVWYTPVAERGWCDTDELREEYGDDVQIDVRWVPAKSFHRNGLTNYHHRFSWKCETDLAEYLAKWKIKFEARRETHRVKAEYRKFRGSAFKKVLRQFSKAGLDYKYNDDACVIWVMVQGKEWYVSFKDPHRPRLSVIGSFPIDAAELVETIQDLQSVLRLASL